MQYLHHSHEIVNIAAIASSWTKKFDECKIHDENEIADLLKRQVTSDGNPP